MTRYSWATTWTTVMIALAIGTAIGKPLSASPVNPQGRGGPEHMKFDDHDRQGVRTWFDANQRSLPAGFRANDRLTPTVELQLHEGFVLDRGLRARVHPVPPGLLHVLAPAPRGYRYVVVDGHVILIDAGYRVFDVIHVGHDG